MKRQILCLVFVILGNVLAEDNWVWLNHQQQRHGGLHNDRVDRDTSKGKYRSETYSRSEQQREREPTTRRPVPGVHQSDDIDDYQDSDDRIDNVGTRQYGFNAGFNGGPTLGGNFNNIPGGGFLGGAGGNGILVGPGGPTGYIGRPHQYLPGATLGNGAAGGFIPGALPQQPGLGVQGGHIGSGGIGGYPLQGIGGGAGGGFGAGGAGLGGGYGGFGGVSGGLGGGNGVYPGGFIGQGQGGYPATGASGSPQYPIDYYGNGQYPGAQYPGIPGQFSGGQYPLGGAGGGAGQYPLGNGQQQYPFYTEGYGLAYTNSGNGPAIPGLYAQNALGYGPNYADQSDKRKLSIEGKSSPNRVESTNSIERNIDDKVNKNIKKS